MRRFKTKKWLKASFTTAFMFHISDHTNAHQTGNNITGSFNVMIERVIPRYQAAPCSAFVPYFLQIQNEGRLNKARAIKVFVFRWYSPLSSRIGLLPKFMRRLSWQIYRILPFAYIVRMAENRPLRHRNDS